MADSTPTTKLTLAGPTSGYATDAIQFTVTPNGDGLVSEDTITPSDGGVGGTFTPATQAIKAASKAPVTFTYIAPVSQIGKTVTLSVTDTLHLDTTSKLAVAITHDPAKTFTVTSGSPVHAGAPTTLTITPAAAPAEDMTVSLSDGNVGGTFGNSIVTLHKGSAAPVTTTYTPKAVGSVTISATNSANYTNPAPVTLAVVSEPSTLIMIAAPRAASVGTPTKITVAPNNNGPAKDTTVSFSDGGAGGVFAPNAVTLAKNSTASTTVEYVPVAASLNKTVTVTATPDPVIPVSGTITLSVSEVVPSIPPYDQAEEVQFNYSKTGDFVPTPDSDRFETLLTNYKAALSTTVPSVTQMREAGETLWMISNMATRIGRPWIFDRLLKFHKDNATGCCDPRVALMGNRYVASPPKIWVINMVYDIFRSMAVGREVIATSGDILRITKCSGLISYIRKTTSQKI